MSGVPRPLVRSGAFSTSLCDVENAVVFAPSVSHSETDGVSDMELENTPPLIRYSIQTIDYDDYVPFATRKQAEEHLNNCKRYLSENVRYMDQTEIQDTLLCIVDAEDELSLFDTPKAGQRK